MNYYNENNPAAAAWLRELMRADAIAPGEVDERSITAVSYDELKRFNQCHFFAGIGGWSYALRLAGWPDERPIWTGSCPCQPFSQAGKRKGTADKRHLWPAFRAAIAECRPATVFGEQVASADGRLWLAGVRADMEALGYAVGAADLCAAGVSAPHPRQRLFGVGNSNVHGRSPRRKTAPPNRHGSPAYTASRHHSRMVNANGYHGQWWSGPLQVGWNCCEAEVERGGRKYRAQWRLKPGLSLLANGIPGRVDQLCGFGNAIVPQLAAEFIQASQEAIAGGAA